MVSQPVINVIIGALLSGILLIINSWWMSWNNNKFQLEREEKQRAWQLEREEQERIWQEKNDQKKWYREKIYDSYRASIQVLTKIIQMETEIINTTLTEDKQLTLSNLHIEFGSEFSIVIAGHPDKNSTEFKENRSKIFDETFEKHRPWNAREIISKIMENDSRIKNINE
jgi:hypothetical protein